jgi:resuscitation-promoting factor RpfB
MVRRGWLGCGGLLLSTAVFGLFFLLLLLLTANQPNQTEPKTEEAFVTAGVSQLPNTAVAHALPPSQQHTITIQQGANQQIRLTNQPTIAQALAEAGIQLLADETTNPPPQTLINADMSIEVVQLAPVTVLVDGGTQVVRVQAGEEMRGTAVLTRAGIQLNPLDYTIPPLSQPLQPGQTLQVVRVREEITNHDQPIPYETILQPSGRLEIDQRQLIQAGAPGVARQTVRLRYENGVLVSEIIEAEGQVVIPPQPEIIGYGTQIVVRSLDTPSGTLNYWRKVRMRVTSYRPNTSGKELDDPDYGITASGLPAGIGVVAVDPKVVPFRSEVYVPNYGRAIAGDTGGGVLGRWIDLGYPDDMSVWVPWSGYVDVYYLTPIPSPERINYLLPEALP